MRNKVLLGMSGGFDSTYAVHALRESGYEVEGAILRMHKYTEMEEAEASARSLRVPLRVIDAECAFERDVIKGFCVSYCNAETPNPCIVCNEKVKFRLLYEEAKKEGFDWIATGHYANIVHTGVQYAVAQARDIKKDQSYMLYRLPQEILSMLLFPLGNLIKSEIVLHARSMEMEAADRPESQEICFVRNESYADYIEKRVGSLPRGHFVDEEGNVLGVHDGIIRYTVGQRKGLGISAATRLFVRDICSENNEIILGKEPRGVTAFLMRKVVFSGIRAEEVSENMIFDAKIRYNAPPVKVKLIKEAGDCWRVCFLEKALSVTPGQSAVLYLDGVVACGGVIGKMPQSTIK